MLFDTFYLLFKSNSADLIKGNKEVEKSTKELGTHLKNTGEEANKLGQEFVKTVEGAASALGGVISAGMILNNVLNTAKSNDILGIQAKLTGQNVVELKSYEKAAQSAGAAAGAFSSQIQKIFEGVSGTGGHALPINQLIDNWRRYIIAAGNDVSEQQRRFEKLGITDAGLKNFFLLPDDQYQRELQKQKELNANVEQGARVAREYRSAWADVEASFDSLSTTIGNSFLPVFQKTSEAATTFLTYLAGQGLGKDIYNVTHGIPINRASQGSASLSRRDKDLAFWVSQGYTKDQAAAWIAGAQAESGGNPNAIGDNGRARGLFQWHPDRRATILRGTGIDVSNASYDDQLKAAAWEAETRGDAARIKATSGAVAAAEIHTRFFERPADIAGESIRRGQAALNIANSTSLGTTSSISSNSTNKTVNVKLGDINVHTAATDSHAISQGIASDLTKQIRIAMGNLDDGVNR